MTKSIEHVIPQIGVASLKLYPPADKLYDRLNKYGEIKRLNKLRHLGMLPPSRIGARQARWDYTAAIIYYSGQLKLRGMNSRFNIGDVEFSSMNAALQSGALIWNCGHLPGTFAVEKGVFRYLAETNFSQSADLLNWPFGSNATVEYIREKASDNLVKNDYLSLCRVLSIIKLLSICSDERDWLFNFTTEFAAPFALEYMDDSYSKLSKIISTYKIVRHLGYLTLDIPTTGLSWAPNIPSLVANQIERHTDIQDLAADISELLSPIERKVYETIYHNDDSREHVAYVAELIHQKLNSASDPENLVHYWLDQGLTRSLKLGSVNKKLGFVGSIKLRSHLSNPTDPPAKIESSIRSKGFDYPVAFEYKAWNSEYLLEPDEKIIDVYKKESVNTNNIGSFIVWIVNNFENFNEKSDDIVNVIQKLELEQAYLALLRRAIEIKYPHIEVRFEAWRLREFGIFSSLINENLAGRVWASSPKLDDPVTKHVLRDRSRRISPDLQKAYAELIGISNLRKKLRRAHHGREVRQKWLTITSSIKFTKYTDTGYKDLIEYDGGLMRVASRSGMMTWYGLETKTKGTNPEASLNKRLKAIGINASAISLNNKHAYVAINL